MTDPRADYDSPWKEALAEYFSEFFAFFFPEISTEIDWKRGYEFLETELQQVMRDDEIGRREADKLAKVWQLDGMETFVLIHIEVQSQARSDFPERMYVYNSRLFGLYRQKVVSLAVLADDDPNWRPRRYELQMWGCRVLLEFPAVKLLDYQQRWEELETNPNPFAAIVMAHLKTQATLGNPEERLAGKISIAKSLYRRGYDGTQIRQLFRLIDWIMSLSMDLEREFRQEIERFEEENTMPYVTSIERLARAEGILEIRRDVVIEILAVRFESVPNQVIEAIHQIEDIELLTTLHNRAVTIASLAEFEQLLAQVTAETGEETGEGA